MKPCVAAALLPGLLLLSGCPTVPVVPPSAPAATLNTAAFDRMDGFLQDLQARASKGMGNAQDFRIVKTVVAYPIGTLMRAETTIPIDFDACAPTRLPPAAAIPNLFPNYSLTRALAGNFALDGAAISRLAAFGVQLKDNANVQFSVKHPKLQTLADVELGRVLDRDDCRKSLAQVPGGAWLVRGYVRGQRSFVLKSENTDKLSARVTGIASFDVALGPGTSSLDLTDTEDNDFLQIISAVLPPDFTGQKTALVVSPDMLSAFTTPTGAGPTSSGNGPRQPPRPTQVVLVTTRSDTGDAAERVLQALRAAAFQPAGDTVRVPARQPGIGALVNYFHDTDRAAAERARDVVRTTLKAATVRLEQVNLPAPQGQIEVWLPGP